MSWPPPSRAMAGPMAWRPSLDLSRSRRPPACADLLTEFLPFGRAALEDAIDGFLAPFEGLGSELVHWRSPVSLVPAATVVAAAALTWDVARRRPSRDVGGGARGGLHAIPR